MIHNSEEDITSPADPQPPNKRFRKIFSQKVIDAIPVGDSSHLSSDSIESSERTIEDISSGDDEPQPKLKSTSTGTRVRYFLNVCTDKEGTIFADISYSSYSTTRKLFGAKKFEIRSGSGGAISVQDIYSNVSPLYKKEFGREFDSNNYTIGEILPEKINPTGTRFKKSLNTVRILDENETFIGHFIDIVLIPKANKRKSPAVDIIELPELNTKLNNKNKSRMKGKDTEDSNVPTMTMEELIKLRETSEGQEVIVYLILGAICYDGKFLGERHEPKKSASNSSLNTSACRFATIFFLSFIFEHGFD